MEIDFRNLVPDSNLSAECLGMFNRRQKGIITQDELELWAVKKIKDDLTALAYIPAPVEPLKLVELSTMKKQHSKVWESKTAKERNEIVARVNSSEEVQEYYDKKTANAFSNVGRAQNLEWALDVLKAGKIDTTLLRRVYSSYPDKIFLHGYTLWAKKEKYVFQPG